MSIVTTYFATTIQFPSVEDYQRLKVLAAIRDEPIGEVLSALIGDVFTRLNKREMDELKSTRPELWTVL